MSSKIINKIELLNNCIVITDENSMHRLPPESGRILIDIENTSKNRDMIHTLLDDHENMLKMDMVLDWTERNLYDE